VAAGDLTYGGLSLNDGSDILLMEGFDPGVPVKTWSEFRSYTGAVAQFNVSEAQLIEMHVPLRIMGTSAADVQSHVAAINALIAAGDQDLVYDDGGGAVTYSCVHSPYLSVPYTRQLLVGYAVDVDLVLYRTP